MAEAKPPMTTAYKLIFTLSILMVFLSIVAAGIPSGTGSGTAGGGLSTLWWIFTAWWMYKRNNQALFSLYRFLFWFSAIASGVALIVITRDILR